MEQFTIKDVEMLSGIKAHTLRIWEQRYNFISPSRSQTKIRYYTNDELKKVLNIALLNKYGYKISHINKMEEAEIQEKILSINSAQAQQERLINDLIKHMVDLNIEAMEEVLDTFIMSRGIEKTILNIIFPFLEKIGILWLTDHINPAQEHFVSNMVRQKLIVGIEAVHPIRMIDKTVLLFLPEGEYHEMGLLFLHFLMKNKGIKVIYLGANIPLAHVEYVVKIKKPDYLYCHLTAGKQFNFERFLNEVARRFPDRPTIISGQLTKTYEKKIKEPISFKRTFDEAMEFVASL